MATAGADSARGVLFDRFGVVLVSVVVTVGVLLMFEVPKRTTETSPSEIAVTLLTIVTLAVALMASGVSRPLLWIGAVALVIFLVAMIVSFATSMSSVGFFRLLWFLLIVATPFLVMRRLVQHRRVTLETLLGAGSVYLLIAVMFMFLYLAIDQFGEELFFAAPEPSTSFMYFSLVTITTLGYGDLTPATEVARAAAAATAVTGQVFLVFVVARLVGLYTAGSVSALRGPLQAPPRIDRNQR